MDDARFDDLAAILPPLLRAMDALEWIGRYFDPGGMREVVAAVGDPDAPVRAALPRLAGWPDELAQLRDILQLAGDAVIGGFDGLRGADGDPRAARRALRCLSVAQEALYGLASLLSPVSAYFLEPSLRDDSDLQMRLAEMAGREGTGVFQAGSEPGERGSFAMFVPETYTPDTAWPLVMALHGGGGNGDAFLWTWLRAARSHGAILVTPTAIGQTWALAGPDPDSPNLARILELVCDRWNVDPTRLLLTGMSDGGTFTYTSGLEPVSPFTHLAPIASSFPAMMASMVDSDRIAGLPIMVAHGVHDWMFPVEVARETQQALAMAGAAVTYREIDDLAHCYPRELNADILAWMDNTRGKVAVP